MRLPLVSDKSPVYVTMRAEGVGLAGQPFCIERDTVLMAGIEFTAGEHQFKLFEQQWKCLVEIP